MSHEHEFRLSPLVTTLRDAVCSCGQKETPDEFRGYCLSCGTGWSTGGGDRPGTYHIDRFKDIGLHGIVSDCVGTLCARCGAIVLAICQERLLAAHRARLEAAPPTGEGPGREA